MARPKPTISQAQFSALANAAGLPFGEAKLAEMYEVYGTVEGMAARVRAPRSVLAEPATIFVDRKSTRLNSSHVSESRMPSSA